MELRQLRTFACIAKLGSFVQAADALGYAQSTVTNHIQTLENELGVRLFERLGHRITLTGPGSSLLPYADQLILLADTAVKMVAGPAAPQGKLTIGTNESLGAYRLPEVLQVYRQAYPGVEMILKFDNCSGIRDQLRRGEIDVGIIISEKVGAGDLVIKDIAVEPMLLAAVVGHPLAQKERVHAQDLCETGVILTEPGCSYRRTLEQIFREFGAAPRSVVEASSIETIKQLILLGLGIALLPRFAVEKELSEGRMCALRWGGAIPEYAVQLLHHKDKWLSPALLAFLRVVGGA